MDLKYKTLKKSISLVSTSDLAFILIIFFILTSYMNQDQGFKLSLSNNDIAPIIIKGEILELTLVNNFEFRIQNKSYQIENFENILENLKNNLKQENKTLYIKLNIAEDIHYSVIVRVIDCFRTHSLDNFSLNLITGDKQ